MKNDAGENQTDALQRASTTYDLDCDHSGMFTIFFSIGIVINNYMSSTLIVYSTYNIEFLYCPKIPVLLLLKGGKLQSRLLIVSI